MSNLFRNTEDRWITLSRIAVNCSIKLRDEYQQFIPPNTGFLTSVIPIFAIGHNFVSFVVANRYEQKSLADLHKAFAGSASFISEMLSRNTKGVSRAQISQAFITELEAIRDRIFECLEQSDTDPDAAIRGICLLLFQKIGVTNPDRRTLEKSIEVTSACFSSAITSLKAEYKPDVLGGSRAMFDPFKKRPSLSERELFERTQGCLGELLIQSGQSDFIKMIETGYLGFKSNSVYYCADFDKMDSDTIYYVSLSDFPLLKTVRPALAGGSIPMIPEELVLVCLHIAKSVKPWKG